VIWIAAAVAIGILFVVMPARTKKVPMKIKLKRKGGQEEILGAGLALGVLRLSVTLFKPAITAFISRKVRGYTADAARKQ